jgi:5-carboxymethyl-2-hydroxymuconic-semialdehyde dehydrogenase
MKDAALQSAIAPPRPVAGSELQQHYIDGTFRPSRSGATFESVNPTTNEVLALAAEGDAADIDDAVQAARRAFDEGEWPHLKAQERAAVLHRIAAAIRAHASEFITREVADIGMPIAQMKGLRDGDPRTARPLISGRR